MKLEMRKLNFIDLKLLQISAVMLTIALAKILPEILLLDIGWYLILGLLFSIGPIYKLLKP